MKPKPVIPNLYTEYISGLNKKKTNSKIGDRSDVS